MRREAQDTCRLYTDLAWLWPMWGDAATEYAHYCRHVTDLIRQHARRPASTLLDMWRRIPRETGFEVHEGRYNAGDDEYTTFACVKTG